MDASKKLKQFCFAFSSFGALGEWKFGGIVASVFATLLTNELRVFLG